MVAVFRLLDSFEHPRELLRPNPRFPIRLVFAPGIEGESPGTGVRQNVSIRFPNLPATEIGLPCVEDCGGCEEDREDNKPPKGVAVAVKKNGLGIIGLRIGQQEGLGKDLVVVGDFGAAIGWFDGRGHDGWTGARGICWMVHKRSFKSNSFGVRNTILASALLGFRASN
jgi:hypothetical protein